MYLTRKSPCYSRTTACLRYSLSLLAGVGYGFSAQASVPPAALNDNVTFDTAVMSGAGIDPRIAEMFRHAPRFLPGKTPVNLSVNGSSRGRVTARFDDNGLLCADKDFQKQAGLISPPGFSPDDACFDLKSAWPQTELHADPGEARVDLVVPQQAVMAPGSETGHWRHGGTAGLLNYDAQYMDSAGQTAGVNFMQLGTEAGFNFSDWIVRSRQTFSRFNGEDTLQYQSAFLQRSFTDSKKVFQAGQISLSNSLFGTGQVLGFQLFPETALQGGRGGAGLVESIADSQSVVEVRQSGVLVYSTTVPAGPFRLQGFSLLNTRSDLDVTVTGSRGERRQFTVPASSLLQNGPAVAPGWSLGVGKLDQSGNTEAPLVGTLANGWALGLKSTLNAGLLGSSVYRAGALSLDSQVFDATRLSVQTTLAQDNQHGHNGMSVNSSLSYQLSERVGINLNASQQTSGYRELSDALRSDGTDNDGNTRNQVGVGISGSIDTLGSLSLSAAKSTTFAGDNRHYLRAGWSRQFGQAYVGASVEHNTGSTTTGAENRFYLTVNIPFGNGRSVSSYLNNDSRGSRAGVNYSDRSHQDGGWSLSSERDFGDRRTASTGSADITTSVSQLGASLSHDSDNTTSWSARASGGLVAHSGGITLSPWRVSDTFGIARVGDEAGVRLDTPGGPTWTDHRGYAVLPSLSGYRRSAIQVDTRSLEKNVDIGNAWQETEAARGSVSYVSFDVVRTRRVLVDVRDAQGKPLPYGASVFDKAGRFITVVGDKGSVFIPDADVKGNLDVQASGTTICSFPLSLPEMADMNGLYETASAVCR